ncbi:MAG: serine/threonine-protein phosphatase [Actinobacteria bacterium]|nr:serine/threonine-protein phosphatase [Actinomycetota bacterium]
MSDVADEGNGRLEGHGILAKLSWGLQSEPGPVRASNEDFADVYAPTVPDDAWDRGPLFVVGDGMGGHAAGEVASRLAVTTALSTWTNGNASPPQQALRVAVRNANTAVYDASLTPGQAGMGTTITALTLAGREAFVGHVGDSRCYRVRAGRVEQLTTDHSRVAEMVRMRLISPEQAASHPARSMLTRSLGGDIGVQIDITRHELLRDDTFVLCSDGLWDVISNAELAEDISVLTAGAGVTPVPVVKQLVGRAVRRGAPDNVTAVVVHVTTDLPIPAAIGRRSLFRRGR